MTDDFDYYTPLLCGGVCRRNLTVTFSYLSSQLQGLRTGNLQTGSAANMRDT